MDFYFQSWPDLEVEGIPIFVMKDSGMASFIIQLSINSMH